MLHCKIKKEPFRFLFNYKMFNNELIVPNCVLIACLSIIWVKILTVERNGISNIRVLQYFSSVFLLLLYTMQYTSIMILINFSLSRIWLQAWERCWLATNRSEIWEEKYMKVFNLLRNLSSREGGMTILMILKQCLPLCHQYRYPLVKDNSRNRSDKKFKMSLIYRTCYPRKTAGFIVLKL